MKLLTLILVTTLLPAVATGQVSFRRALGVNAEAQGGAVTAAAFTDATTGTISYWLDTSMANDNSIAWIFSVTRNADATGTDFGIFHDESVGNENISFRFRTDGVTQWRANTPIGSLPGIYAGAQWSHFVMTQDGVEAKLYIDNTNAPLTFITSTDKTQWIVDLFGATSPSDRFQIGTFISNGDTLAQHGPEEMSDVRVYDRELSLDEIALIFHTKGRDHVRKGLVLWMNGPPAGVVQTGDFYTQNTAIVDRTGNQTSVATTNAPQAVEVITGGNQKPIIY